MGPRRSSAVADKSSSQRFDNVHAQVCGNFRRKRWKPANRCRPRSSVRSGKSSDLQSASTRNSSPSKHEYRTKSRNRFVFIFSTPLSPVGGICPPNPHARRNASCRTRNRPGILSIGRHWLTSFNQQLLHPDHDLSNGNGSQRNRNDFGKSVSDSFRVNPPLL